MTRGLLSPVGILDATHGAVSLAAAPWLGLCWLSLMPLRLAQVHFIREVARLGTDAAHYAGHLGGSAWIVWAALLPAIWGRTVWVQACRLALQSGARPGREALRLPPARFLNALYVVLLSEVLFAATAWTMVTAPALVLLSGLAYVAALRTDRPGLIQPLLEAGRLAAHLRVVVALLFTYAIALLVAFVNVYLAFRGVLWAASALGDPGVPRWEHLFRSFPLVAVLPAEPLVGLLCAAGAALAVEPFWLASLAVFAHRERLRDSGEDLRLRFRQLVGAP